MLLIVLTGKKAREYVRLQNQISDIADDAEEVATRVSQAADAIEQLTETTKEKQHGHHTK